MLNVLVTMRFTEGQLNRRAPELRAMKASAYFVNVGHGLTVDESALAHADHRIAGAVVDVRAQGSPPSGHPFHGLDNVIVSPHVSGCIPSYDDKCSVRFAENLQRDLDGAPLLNLVDRVRGY
jgi:phosphoglycerate dehydrogenase-like enzyme